MTGNESASEIGPSPANRDFAGPTKNQPISGVIKGLFRAAVKAITRRDEDEPPQQPRRRSGEKHGGGPIMARPAQPDSKPATCGRYAVLQPVMARAGKIMRRFSRAATDTAAPEVYDEAAHGLADTLAVLYQQNDEAFDTAFDDCGPARNTCASLDP